MALFIREKLIFSFKPLSSIPLALMEITGISLNPASYKAFLKNPI